MTPLPDPKEVAHALILDTPRTMTDIGKSSAWTCWSNASNPPSAPAMSGGKLNTNETRRAFRRFGI